MLCYNMTSIAAPLFSTGGTVLSITVSKKKTTEMVGLRGVALAIAMAFTPVFAAAAADSAAPSVLATTKPLHALTAMVMEGVGTPHLLIKGATSPHTFSLKPSDRRVIGDAALVVWTGPGIERVLEKTLHPLSESGRALEVADLPGLTLLPAREGGVWEAHHHDDDHGDEHHGEAHHDDHHDGHDGDVDPHLWLDPINATVIVKAVAARLSAIDPGHADRYRANAESATRALADLDRELAATLAPVKDRPFIVFHDAYHYAESRYGLNPAGSITIDPDREPSAKRLSELRARITEGGVACVFTEPQFEPKLVHTVIEGTSAKTGTLDPIGADLKEGPELYPALMRGLATSLVACLKP